MRVSSAEFHRIKAKIKTEHRHISGKNFQGSVTDFDYYLDQSDIIRLVKLRKTGELDALLEARCEARFLSNAASEIIPEVERIWVDHLAYRDFEAHTINVIDDEVVMDFVSVAGSSNYYVTGRIIVKMLKDQ